MLLVLFDGVAIGHAGYVIGDGAVEALVSDAFVVVRGELLGMFDEVFEELAHPVDGKLVVVVYCGMIVHVLK